MWKPRQADRPKRASYREGVAWIALNDDPASSDALNAEELQGLISVALLADLFGKDQLEVAKAVVAYRKKET